MDVKEHLLEDEEILNNLSKFGKNIYITNMRILVNTKSVTSDDLKIINYDSIESISFKGKYNIIDFIYIVSSLIALVISYFIFTTFNSMDFEGLFSEYSEELSSSITIFTSFFVVVSIIAFVYFSLSLFLSRYNLEIRTKSNDSVTIRSRNKNKLKECKKEIEKKSL